MAHQKSDLDNYLISLKKANDIKCNYNAKSNLVQHKKNSNPLIIIEEESIPQKNIPHQKQNPTQNVQSQVIEFDDKIEQLFQGYYILFPLISARLTKQRAQILADLTNKYGGSSWIWQATVWDKWIEDFKVALQNKKAYIAVGSDIKQDILEQKIVSLSLNFKEVDPYIILADWISQSIQKQTLLPLQNFTRTPQVIESDATMKIIQSESQSTTVQSNPHERQFLTFDDNLGRIVPKKQPSRDVSPSPTPSVELDFNEELPQEYFFVWKCDYDRPKQIEKKKQISKQLKKSYRALLDYGYDPLLDNYHCQYDDDEEDLIDLQFLKKEEFHDEKLEMSSNSFKGDDECFIYNVKKPPPQAVSLFEGIKIPLEIDVFDSVQTSVVKDYSTLMPGLRRKAQFWEQKKEQFACEAGSSSMNYNKLIIEQLDRLLRCYTNDRDKGRINRIAYKRAIAFIKSLKFPIKSEDDVKDMPTIGAKIKRKICEILQTGKLQKAEFLSSNVKNKVIDQFSKVWGIGAQIASNLYFKGMRSLDDLRKNQYLLTRNQIIGLKYVDDFQQRIPRAEATKIYEIVRDTVNSLSEIENIFESIPCGSYRRGKDSCGDMDILITRKDGKDDPKFMNKLIEKLENVLLTDHLVHPKPSPQGSINYMGVGRIGLNPHRRIDLKFYPREQFGYAVLYFTGSDHFNRSMRLFAQKKGYTLSDHGLFPTLRTVRNQKVWQGELVPCYTEEEVFKILGLTYKRPDQRSI